MKNHDPYLALRFKEFNYFLLIRFLLVFGWSMQFIIVEWEVYNLTKDPLVLGLIGLVEIIPAISMSLFAGHIVDQKEKKKLFTIAIISFLFISVAFFSITTNYFYSNYSSKQVLTGIYILVFIGGFIRAFFGPIIFSLRSLFTTIFLPPSSIYTFLKCPLESSKGTKAALDIELRHFLERAVIQLGRKIDLSYRPPLGQVRRLQKQLLL